jgi:hypothetical protein
MGKHPGNPEIPAATDGHTPDSCPLAAEQQAEKGRREVAAWIMGVLTTVAIGVGGWAHVRLWTDNDRLTKLETQRDIESKALDHRLNTMENNLTRQISELRDLLRSNP